MNKTKIAAAFDKPASDPKNNFASASEEPEFGPKKEPEVKPLVRLPVGVDLAKKYIQVCFKDPVTGKIINKQLTRAQFAKFLAGSKYGPMMVGMEACGTCTYWGHFCLDHGHIPVILPAQLVHANNTGNKDDANDARCIWRLLFLPDIETKKIRLRSTDNQDLMSMMKLQESLAKIETQIENIVRHYLLERGVTSNKGAESVMNSLKKYCEDTIEVLGLENERSAMLSVVSSSFCGLMKANISSEQAITDYIISWAASNEKCKLLMTIPYVGPIAAAAIAIYMEDPSYFKNGRQFTALCRMVPYHTGTGGKVEILGIHRNGIEKAGDFRSCPIHHALVCCAVRTDDILRAENPLGNFLQILKNLLCPLVKTFKQRIEESVAVNAVEIIHYRSRLAEGGLRAACCGHMAGPDEL